MTGTAKKFIPSDIYPFTPRRFSVDGHSLSYVDEGEGPVVLLLHGNPTWSFMYRRLIPVLSRNYRVIALDHLGCGLSDKPQDFDYTLASHIKNVEALLDGLGITRFSLIMHDWGGAIGMGAAGRRADQVQSLVVMNTAAFRSHRIPLRIKICRTPIVGTFFIRWMNIFAGAAIYIAVKKKMAPEVAAGYLAPYDSWHNRIAIDRFVQDIPLSSRHVSWHTLSEVEKGLEQFKHTPMLLVWGGADFCFNRHFFKEWQQRFPHAQAYYYEDAGHYLMEDAFESIAPNITEFLAKTLGVPGDDV